MFTGAVTGDDEGFFSKEKNDYLFKYKDIDPSPEDATNKCLMYFNNYEPLQDFGKWPKLLGDARECCYRFTTKSKAATH